MASLVNTPLASFAFILVAFLSIQTCVTNADRHDVSSNRWQQRAKNAILRSDETPMGSEGFARSPDGEDAGGVDGTLSKTEGQRTGTIAKKDSFIINGQDVSDVGKYPWQGALRVYGGFVCGCSLIDTQHVLTAAHCINHGASAFSVTLGMHDLSREVTTPLDYQVDTVHIHPDYLYNWTIGFPNDLALLHLAESVNTSSWLIGIVDREMEEDVDYEMCTASGWGYTSSGSSVSNILQEAEFSIINQTACIDAYDEHSITSSQVCTYNNQTGTCSGDSGGPLQCVKEGAWRLVGVTSWGEGCDVTYPTVFTRVSAYTDWIDSIINMQNATSTDVTPTWESMTSEMVMTSEMAMTEESDTTADMTMMMTTEGAATHMLPSIASLLTLLLAAAYLV